jgi:hypothetical protein
MAPPNCPAGTFISAVPLGQKIWPVLELTLVPATRRLHGILPCGRWWRLRAGPTLVRPVHQEHLDP